MRPIPAFAAPAASSGKRIEPRNPEYLKAKMGGQNPEGRIAQVDRASFAKLAAFQLGDSLSIPLMDGEQVQGKVNLVQPGRNNWIRVAGELTGARKGSFVLAANGAEVAGLVQLPRERLAYQIMEERDGRTLMVEQFRADVICDPLPPMENEPAFTPSDAPQGAVPILNSRPEATAVFYLDFDGEVVTDPLWPNERTGGPTINAASFNKSAAEITRIFNWVKEDWWPFNVNLTTDVARYDAAPIGSRMRCIITPTNDAAPGAGGVAYLTSFRNAGTGPYSDDIPCWVFNSSEVGITEAISHEFGHTMGLSHDGRSSPSEGYYQGHGSGATSWAPIMGVGYYVKVSQWSKGEYLSANQKEDDLAIISAPFNKMGYVADDAGNTRTSAASLNATAGAGVITQVGAIERSTDSDFYRFSTNGGAVTINAQPASPSPNLDISLEIQDSNGALMGAVGNPAAALNASLSMTLPPGLYYLKVTNSGVGTNVLTTGYSTYGSLGAYTLSGTIAGFTNNPVITSPSTVVGQLGKMLNYTIRATGSPTSFGVIEDLSSAATRLPVGVAVDPMTGVISGIPGEAGEFNVQVTATNVGGTGTAPLKISIAPPSLTVAQAVDFQALEWLTGGDAEWSGQTIVKSDGVDAARAGDIGHTQQSYLQTNVTGPTKVSFRWKVSSDAADVLVFQIDGVDVPDLDISGEVDWTQVTEVPVPEGPHQLRWVYRKNDSIADGQDTAWVDVVTFISSEAPGITSSSAVAATVGEQFLYQITATNLPGSFAVASGSLPPGLSLDTATGRIKGVPAVAGSYAVVVSATNNIGAGTQPLTITVAASPITVGEALDNLTAAWVLGGNAFWFSLNDATLRGGDGLQAGPIAAGQSTTVQTTVEGPKTVQFRWKTESEPGNDRLTFMVDSEVKATISGFTEWQNPSVLVPAGSHIVTWTYQKNGSVSLGADTGYLDAVVITTDLLPEVSGSNATGQVGSNFNYVFSATNLPTSYSAEGLPAGLTISPTSAEITGAPTVDGVFNVILGATNEAGTGTKAVVFTIAKAPPTIGSAVDAQQLFWTTGGDAPWLPQEVVSFDGVDAARSGVVGNSQRSFMETQIIGPVTLLFRWKVKSEAANPASAGDNLQFHINNEFKTQISGDIDWQLKSYPLPAGRHTVRWTYQKDSSVAALTDTAWVDAVSLSTVDTVPVINSPLAVSAYIGRNFRYQIAATNTPTSFTAANLPQGLTLNAGGLITGVPTSSGMASVNLGATNANGTGVAALALDVLNEPPGADRFADATSIGGVFIRSETSNFGATSEAGEPTHAGQAATGSIWWQWTAPLTGEVQVDTAGSNIDTVLSVRRGTALNNLTLIGENDDSKPLVSSSVKFLAQARTTYYIAVDGRSGANGNIVLNVGYTATGVYSGLLQDVNEVAAPGMATISLTSKFTFTGAFFFGANKFPLKGVFTGEDFFGTVQRKGLAPLDVALHLDLSPGAEEVTGTVKADGVTYSLFARHAMNKADVASMVPQTLDATGKPLPRLFTFLLEPDAVGTDVPAGVGSGSVAIDASGKVKAKGILGDGTKFSASALLANDRSWIFFLAPYKSGGVVAASVALDAGGQFAPLSGQVAWRKTAMVGAKSTVTYPGGFSTSAQFNGYRFAKPDKDTPALVLSTPANNLQVNFTSATPASDPADFTATLDTSNKLTGGPDKLKFSFNAGSGLFSGALPSPSGGKPLPISGAIVNGTEFVADSEGNVTEFPVSRGAGLFISGQTTGAVDLTPIPVVPVP